MIIHVGIVLSDRVTKQDTHPGRQILRSKRTVEAEYYSIAKADRAGSATQDMLLAHAYGWHQNLTYGGACLPWFVYSRPTTQRLLNDIGLASILKYNSCPPRGNESMIVKRNRYKRRETELITKEWRESFRSMLPPRENKSKNVFDIVVHVRRGDIDPCFKPQIYLPNSLYLKLIDKYLPNAGNLSTHVTIFSETDSYESFDVFRRRNYSVRLDTDLATCWNVMMDADVLILAKSSFSFVPAVLNPNTVVYTTFWHFPMNGWDIVDSKLVAESEEEARSLKEDACTAMSWLTRIPRGLMFVSRPKRRSD